MGKYDLPEDNEEEINFEDPILESEEHFEFVAGAGINVVSNTALELFNNGIEYFRWCKANPIITKRLIQVGTAAGKKMSVEHTRPYTIKGLCLHCNIDEEYISDIRSSKDKANEYYVALSKLLYIIYVQNLEGAMVDIYNPMFTSKVLNIEKEETPTGAVKVEHVSNVPPLLENESEVLEKLDRENPDWIKEEREKY